MKKKIIVPYFPSGIKYSTPLLFILGLYLIFTSHPVWGALIIVIGIVILTTRYVTEISLADKRYIDYLFFLGFRLNQEVSKFNVPERIIITKGSVSQRVVSRIQSRQIDWSEYTATLLFDNEQSLELLSANSKADLTKILKEYSHFLNVRVEDRTTPMHFWVDLDRA